MINTIYASTVHKPNFQFRWRSKEFNLDMTGHQAIIDTTGIMWVGDVAHISGGSKLMHAEMALSSWMKKNNDGSGKLKKIRNLVNSGRYKIDSEKLAEKMLGRMVSLLMTR